MSVQTGIRTSSPRPALVEQPAARWLALGAAAGPVLFTATWLVLGFLSPGYTAWGSYVPYSAIHQGISGLGMGPTAPYMNAAFVLNGLLTLAGVVGVFLSIEGMGAASRRACIAMLAVPAVGSVVDGLFTLESFMPHTAGFALAVTPALSFPAVGFLLRRVPGWRRFGVWLIAGGPLTLVLAVLFFVSFTPTVAGSQAGVAGLLERVVVVEMQAWYVAMAVLAFRHPAPGTNS